MREEGAISDVSSISLVGEEGVITEVSCISIVVEDMVSPWTYRPMEIVNQYV
jgi:leucyl aminopeptidase